MTLFKKWREKFEAWKTLKQEKFRVWITKYLYQVHVQPVLNYIQDTVARARSEADYARLKADEANERSAELGRMIGNLQRDMRGVQAAARFLAARGDTMEERIATLEDKE